MTDKKKPSNVEVVLQILIVLAYFGMGLHAIHRDKGDYSTTFIFLYTMIYVVSFSEMIINFFKRVFIKINSWGNK